MQSHNYSSMSNKKNNLLIKDAKDRLCFFIDRITIFVYQLQSFLLSLGYNIPWMNFSLEESYLSTWLYLFRDTNIIIVCVLLVTARVLLWSITLFGDYTEQYLASSSGFRSWDLLYIHLWKWYYIQENGSYLFLKKCRIIIVGGYLMLRSTIFQ